MVLTKWIVPEPNPDLKLSIDTIDYKKLDYEDLRWIYSSTMKKYYREFCNLKGFVQNANTPLNASGKNQATLLHKALNKRNISKVLSSDFTRAEQTIKKFAQEKNIPCIWSATLRERDFGELKGMFYKDINKTEVFEENFSPPGGEDLKEFKTRVDYAWDEIIEAGNSLSGELVIITHGLIIKDLLKRNYCNQLPNILLD